MQNFAKIKGSIIAVIGFLLSPLSWWNDIFINIPLAYVFAYLVSLIFPNWFLGAMIVGYLATNVFGMIMMNLGIKNVFQNEKNNEEDKKEKYKDLVKDILVSVLYTAFIIFLYKIGWLKPPLDYFR